MLNMKEKDVIKIDKIDKKILLELDKNCRISSQKLARTVKKSRQAVDYRINNLVKNNIISNFQSSINPHKMGYKLYKVYLKLRNSSSKNKLIDYLKQSEIVYWMGECSGSWDIIFGVFCKTDLDFYEFKNEFLSKFHNEILEHLGEWVIDVKQFVKGYLLPSSLTPVTLGGEIVFNKLDDLDLKIIERMVSNGRISIIELSTELKTGSTTIINRIKRLEKLEVLVQHRIGINIQKLNLELYKAIIKFDKFTKEDEKRFFAYCSSIPQIQYFIRNMWQTELEFVVKNYKEYIDIIEKLKSKFEGVIRNVDSVLMITDEWTPGFKNLLKSN
jgi:DNA-binding Lrp family transcriptional regulator